MADITAHADKQIEVLFKGHLAYLRTDVDQNTESLRSAIRYLLLGVPGLVVLREKFDLNADSQSY